MKTRIYNKAAVALIALLVFTSCNDLFNVADIKNNPNAPLANQVDLKPLMTGTLVGLGSLHEDTDVRLAYMWGGQLAGQSRQHAGFQNYTVAASTFGWGNYYNVGVNIRQIQSKSAVTNNKAFLGAAQVMEVLLFTKLITLWGDVPYTEAFDLVKFPTPKYDGQLAMYGTLVTLLNKAYANLTSGVGTISGDFVYSGSASKWARAAKSLQARLYLHLKDYPNAIAAGALGISSTGDDMLMPHGSAYQVDFNMNFDFFDYDRPGDTSFDAPAYLPVFMCTKFATGVVNQDVAVRNSKTDETGMYFHFFQYGAESANGRDPNTADGMFISTAPQPWLTYYETQLIVAEAAARLNAGAADPAAITALNNVRAGLETGYINGQTSTYTPLVYTAYVAADFAPAGIAFPTTIASVTTAQHALIYEILSQKFVVTISQYEVFNDLRRTQTATPVIKLPIPVTPGQAQFPARFIYPQNEINTNPNVPKTAGQVPNQFVKLPIFQ